MRTLAIRAHFKVADQQRREDVFRFVIRPNTNASASRGNVRVIVRRNIVFAAVCRIDNERQKRLSSESLANILRHCVKLPAMFRSGNTTNAH